MLTNFKQTPLSLSYYTVIANTAAATSYVNSGTENAPLFTPITTTNLGCTANGLTLASTIGSVLRDEGKKIVSANRVFRKVQLLVNTGSVLSGSTGSDGVAGAAGTATVLGPYLTYYIELPSGDKNSSTVVTPVARLG